MRTITGDRLRLVLQPHAVYLSGFRNPRAPLSMMRAEDGKLHSQLEWPYTYLKSCGFYLSFSSTNSSLHKMHSLINASINNLLVHGFKQNFGHHQCHLWPICPTNFE